MITSYNPQFLYASDSGSGVGTPISGGVPSGSGLGFAQQYPRTLLPLPRYAELMQIPLTHFQQLNGILAPTRGGCDDLWDQDARNDLAWSMITAEELIAQQLGYWPAPKYETAEEVSFGLQGIRSDWRNAEIRTKNSWVQDYGTEVLTLKQADATVTYSDLDNDPFGRAETAIIGNELYADIEACDNVCDIAVFFREADGATDPADPRWEIRPLTIDIDGSIMKIRANAALFVKPELWALTEQDCRGSDDPTKWKWNYDLSNLVSMVDVYCRTTSLETPITLQWDGVCGCTNFPCAHSTQCACAYQTDKKRGFFVPRPATWNGTTNIEAIPLFASPPESILVNYLSGYPTRNLSCRMDTRLERAIVKLTNSLLPEPPCGFCDAAQTRWQSDRKNVDPLTPEAASMPWDLYTQGALEAWRIVKMMSVGRGSKLGRSYG